jgi:tape measure domain-containing protein
MSGQVVTLRLTGDASGIVSAAVVARKEVTGLGTAAEQTGARGAAGINRLERGVQGLSPALERAQKAFLAVFGLGLIERKINALAGMADQYSNITGRLRLVTSGEAALAAARERTFSIAQATNAQYESTATLYSRLIKSTQALGLSQIEQASQASTLATAINQSFAVSSSSSASAAAGVMQLSQGLASGVLRGDEFNSVMENSSRLAQALADGLGVNIGRLREMAEAGQLTSEVVINALSSQAAAIGADFAQLPLTIERSWTNLQNALVRYVGQSDQTIGASRSIAESISSIADNIEPVLDALILVGKAIILAYGGRALAVVSDYVNKMLASVAVTVDAARAEGVLAAAELKRTQARTLEIAGTLDVINLARTELVAKQALARVDIESAAATLRATEATAFLSGSVAARRIATEQMTAAQLRLNVVTTEMAVLGKQQASVQAQLAASSAAQIAAQTQANAVMTLGQRAMAGLAGAGRTLFALVGGWAGVAVAGAYGLYKLWEAVEEGEARIRAPITSIEAYTESLRKLTLEEKARAAGVSVDEYSEKDRFEALTLATRQWTAELVELQDRLQQIQSIGTETSGGAELSITSQIDKLRDRLDAAKTALENVTEATRAHEAELASNMVWIDGSAEAHKRLSQAVSGVKDSLAKQIQTLEAQRIEQESGLKASLQFKAAQEAGLKSTDDLDAATLALIDSIVNSTEALARNKTAATAAAEAQREKEQADRDSKRAAVDYIASLQDQMKTYGLTGKAQALYLLGKQNLTAAQREEARTIIDHIAGMENLAQTYQDAARALEDLRGMGQSLDDQIIDLQDQIAGADSAQIEYNRTLRDAAAAYLEAAAAADPSAIVAYTAAVNKAREVLDLRRTLDAQNENLRASEQAAERTSRVWSQMYGDLSQAFGDWVASGAKSFSDFASQAKQIFKKMLADMVAQMVQSGLMRMFAGFFGGGTSGAAMAGGGSSGGFNFSSLFGGGSGAASSAMPWLAALGGAAYGAQNPGNNGFASAARIGTYAVGGYALGATALGAIGGATAAGAATAGAGLYATGSAIAGGAAAGGMTAAAAIPIVGWIIAALAIIDAVSGGKLFGTKYKPQSVTQGLNIDAEGGYASTTLHETRQAALFGGIRRRDRTIDPTDDAERAAGEFFQSMQDLSDSVTTALGGTSGVIDAAIRTVIKLDKKGKEKSREIFVDVLNRTWKEATEELAGKRLSAEQLIKSLDDSMRTAQTAAAQAIVDSVTFGVADGLQNAGGAVSAEFNRFVNDVVEGVTLPGPGQLDDLRNYNIPDGGGRGGRDPSNGAGSVPANPNGTSIGNPGEASRIAERWRHDAEVLMEGASFLLTAATDMRAGFNLLGDDGTLTQITDLIEELAYSGETLTQTYQRVATSARLLDQALELSGVSISGTREEIVRMAVDIAEAAGGIDRAGQLWANYFNRFYSEQERGIAGLEQARTSGQGEFDDIGLNIEDFLGEGGLAAFRELLENRLPTLSAEATVHWLEAAAALTGVVDAQAAYNAIVEQSETALADAVQAELDRIAALEAAQVEYRSFIEEIRRQTADLSDFQLAMLEAEDWRSEAVDQANAHARAAGMAGASEQALALVELRASQLRAQALAQLEEETQSLIDQLYGSGSAADGFSDGLQAATDAANQYWESQRQSALTLQQYLDNMLLGDLSALTPEMQLEEAWRQLNEAVQDGDATRATQLSDVYLRLLRAAEASGDDFNNGFQAPDGSDVAGFWDVRALLQGMLDRIGVDPDGVPPSGVAGPITAADAEQIAAQNRLDLAVQLAQHLADLSGELEQNVFRLMEDRRVDLHQLTTDLGINLQTITGESVLALANMAQLLGSNLTELTTELGLTLSDLGNGIRELAEQMGIDLTALTVESTQALAGLANQLGLDLSQLATSVGANLGSLADAQSLLNQALGAQIQGLPVGQRDELAPLFDAITAATNAADANTAIGALEAAVNLLAPDLRNELAPYLEGVFPADALSDLDYLASVAEAGAAQVAALDLVNITLDRIAANLSAANTAAGIPSYAVGTGYVPRTGLANIHEGEAIIPAPFASWLRSNGFPVGGGGDGSNEALRAELREVRAELKRVTQAVQESGAHVATTVDAVGSRSDRSNDSSRSQYAQPTGRSYRGG